MPGALDGIKILEFTEIIAGPFGGMLLADMGADVIKVEPPWGDPWRHAFPIEPGESKTFMSLNRGKRSLPLDLTKQEGRDVVYRLIPDMDAVIINYRPDVPYNLGIDYETLSAINPRLIYCENTAFGRNGPHSQRPGYDIIAQAMTGILASEDKINNGVPQQVTSTPVADFSTALAAAWSVCAALFHRERSGKGQKIETTLLGSALAVQSMRFMEVERTDSESRAEFYESLKVMQEASVPYEDMHSYYREHFDRRRASSLQVYYRTYQAADGVLAVGCLSDPLRKRLIDVLGLRDIRFEPDYDMYSEESLAFYEKLTAQAEELFRQCTVSEWLETLDAAGVPAGPVRFVEELVSDEQVVSNGLVLELEHSVVGKVKMVGPMLKMSETPLEPTIASPALGEHTDSVLTQYGYAPKQIRELRELGITR